MKIEVSEILTYRMMKRILSIAALLLIATASMANAPKPDKEVPKEEEKEHCIRVTVVCGVYIVRDEVCGKTTQELFEKAMQIEC